jgi:hypothetical protein
MVFDPQTPNDHLDNQFDFSAVLPSGDTISTATVTSDDVAMVVSSLLIIGSAVTAWISGGTAGTRATITCHATSAAGRILNRSTTMEIRAVVP